MNTITLTDLNFYYSFIREIAENNLKELNQDYTEDLLSNNIRLLLSTKMQNQKALKKEIEDLKGKIIEPSDHLF